MGERKLPTAAELAPFHRAHELIELKRLATELGDNEAVTLLDATIRERKVLDLNAALGMPAQQREWEAREQARKEQYAAGYIPAEAYERLGDGLSPRSLAALTPLAGVAEARLGAGGSPPPSE